MRPLFYGRGPFNLLTVGLVIVFTLALQNGSAQTDNEIMKKSYRFLENVLLKKCNATGAPISVANYAPERSTGAKVSALSKKDPKSVDTSVAWLDDFGSTATEQFIKKGVQFEIVKPLQNEFVIMIYKDDNKRFNNKYLGVDKDNPSDDERVVFYLLPRADFQGKCDERLAKHGFTFGAVIMPIKMRFGSLLTTSTTTGGTTVTSHRKNFTFSGEVSAGLLIGIKHDYSSRSSISFLSGISLTSVPVDSETTGGFITSPTNASALSWPFGIVYQYDKVQFGAFIGLDFLAGEVSHHWVYRKNVWAGIGVGFSIFTAKSSNSQ